MTVMWFSGEWEHGSGMTATAALERADTLASSGGAVTIVSLPEVPADEFSYLIGGHGASGAVLAQGLLKATGGKYAWVDMDTHSLTHTHPSKHVVNTIVVSGRDEKALRTALDAAAKAVNTVQESNAAGAVFLSIGGAATPARVLSSAPLTAASNGTSASTDQIRIVPEVIAGLVISLFLAFFVAVGLSCVMTVQTPDVMHSTTLPAGKEF